MNYSNYYAQYGYASQYGYYGYQQQGTDYSTATTQPTESQQMEEEVEEKKVVNSKKQKDINDRFMKELMRLVYYCLFKQTMFTIQFLHSNNYHSIQEYIYPFLHILQ